MDITAIVGCATAPILAIIALCVWCGKLQQTVANLSKKCELCPIGTVGDRLGALEVKTGDIWSIFIEDGKMKRPDLFHSHSPLKATEEAKTKVPEEVRELIKQVKSNGHSRGDVYLEIRAKYTAEKFIADARIAGVSLQVYAALIEDVAADMQEKI